MAHLSVSVILALMLAGCAGETVTVRVPVFQRAEPPPELLEPMPAPAGVFSPPGQEGAVACLLPAGKDQLVGYVDALRRRLAAWEAWGR